MTESKSSSTSASTAPKTFPQTATMKQLEDKFANAQNSRNEAIQQELAAQDASVFVADSEESKPQGKIYTSHPIPNYRLGKFKFTNGSLVLETQEEIDSFEKTLEGLPLIEKLKVREINVARAVEIAKANRFGKTIQGPMDSTIGGTTGSAVA